jgi:transcriptional regulator with XRE-family HTH domain
MELDPRRARLAAQLRRLRKAAGLAQADMAYRTGWVQPKVSRLETGTQLPTEEDIRTWAAYTYASAEETEALLDMLSAAHIEYIPTADLLRRGGLARRQAHLGAMEAAAGRIGEYQPAFIPGLLQIPAYTRALLDLPGSARSKGATDADCEAVIAARARRQAIITEPGHRFQFVIGEIALWSAPDGTDAQRKQLEHLIATIDLPDVELGVIPLRSPMPVAPLSGFRLLDAELVFIESLTGEQVLTETDAITPVIEAFEVLRAAATTGRGALALIRSVASEMA